MKILLRAEVYVTDIRSNAGIVFEGVPPEKVNITASYLIGHTVGAIEFDVSFEQAQGLRIGQTIYLALDAKE